MTTRREGEVLSLSLSVTFAPGLMASIPPSFLPLEPHGVLLDVSDALAADGTFVEDLAISLRSCERMRDPLARGPASPVP